MSKDPFLIAKEEKITSEQSKISANSLFNFMRNYNYLEKVINDMAICPRYYPEDIRYLNLKINSKLLEEWYIPMTCFCDIPLHQIHFHAEGDVFNGNDGYGKFSIAFHKKYGIKMGIQPVHYLCDNSLIVTELAKAMNALINRLDGKKDNGSEYTKEFLIEYIRLIKPYYGKMKKKDSQNTYIDLQKNFHDEHEWRYIPEFEFGELPLILIEEREISAENLDNTFTESIPFTKKGMLKFNVDDVRYIFVDNLDSRNKLINFIRKKRKGKRLSKKEKDILISKIMIYDELKEDW